MTRFKIKHQFLLLAAPCALFACSGGDGANDTSEGSASAITITDVAQYNFESGRQGWVSTATNDYVYSTSTRAFAGLRSLAVSLSGASGAEYTYVANPVIPAGTTVDFRVWCPSGTSITGVQPFALEGSSGNWRWTGNWRSIGSLQANAWNTISITLPTNMTPLAELGVQFQSNAGSATTCFVDSVGWGSGVGGGNYDGGVTDSGGGTVDSGSGTVDSGSGSVDGGMDAAQPPADSGTTSTSKLWVSGYYVGYQQDAYPPSAVDFTGLTHLIVGAVNPLSNGTLDTTLSTHGGPAMASTLSGLAHAAGKKAILMIGGAGQHDTFASAASSTYRAAFVANLKSTMTTLGYDGLDLDWEPLTTADFANFKSLATDLRAAMPGMLLTVPVGWSDPVDPFYGTIAPLFDQINMMTYGMADAWPGWQSWHSSALQGQTSTGPSSIDRYAKAYEKAGVPAAKIGMGIGFYGSCWSAGVNAPLQNVGSSSVVASDNTMSFTNIMSSYYSASARHWDANALVPYLSFASATGPAKCTFVSYDDAQSIAEKGKYAHAAGLGGAIIWTIAQGYLPTQPVGSQNPLLQATKAGFLN